MRIPRWMKLPITRLLFQRLHGGRKNDMLRLQNQRTPVSRVGFRCLRLETRILALQKRPEPQYVDLQYLLHEDHKVPKDNLWTSYDKQIKQEEDHKTEQSTRSDNLSQVFNGEHGDQIPHLSDIDEELDDSGHTVDVAGKTEDTAHDSAHEVPDTDGNEDQQSSNDVHSATVERAEGHETSHSTEDEKSNPIRVEEREVDSGLETVHHPEVEPHNAPHEQVHDRGEAHQRLAEELTTREAEQDHSECESSNSRRPNPLRSAWTWP
ncbi:hypothetical protein BGZ57DRAFT_115361 [Hyaloscypha finlandica]|nr:hypothetical protein BGZ57DRAFT_115361 [Hyaloscypha finlandica]